MEAKRINSLNAAAAIVLLILVLPALYVLSIGPVVYLATTGRIHYTKTEAAHGFYAPLFQAADICPPAGAGLSWYISLWAQP